MSTGGGEVDGRSVRRLKNRASVLRAYGTLLSSGVVEPSFEQIAEQSGVSYRSVYRYFDNIEDLKAAALVGVLEWVGPQLEKSTGSTTSADPLLVRIDDLVNSRLAVYDKVHGTVMLALFNVGSSPAFAESITAARHGLRDRIGDKFAPELAPYEPASRQMRLSVITQCLGFSAFDFYFEHFGHTHDDVRQLLRAQVYSAITAGTPDY